MPYYILQNMRLGGITVHKVAEGYDAGDILFQKEFKLTEKDNLETYMIKAIDSISDELDNFSEKFHDWCELAVPQQGNGVYLKAPSEDMFTVNSSDDVKTADRVLRAVYGYECYYKDGADKYMLIRAEAVESDDHISCDDKISLPLSDGYVVCEKEHILIVK